MLNPPAAGCARPAGSSRLLQITERNDTFDNETEALRSFPAAAGA